MSSKKPTLRISRTRLPARLAPTSDPPAQAGELAWGGHHRVTRVALQAILERARWGTSPATLEERVLANVCELRRAAVSGEWPRRMTGDCHAELAAARFTLNEVGAMNVAAYLSKTMAALHGRRSPQRQETLLLKLRRDLNAAGPMLDALIARYAQSLLDAGLRSEPPPAMRRNGTLNE